MGKIKKNNKRQDFSSLTTDELYILVEKLESDAILFTGMVNRAKEEIVRRTKNKNSKEKNNL
jgi:hypothetical protein